MEGFGSTAGWLDGADRGAGGGVPQPSAGGPGTAADAGRPGRRSPPGSCPSPRVRLLAAAFESALAVFARDELVLVEQARSLSARVFPLAVAHWRRLADPDGAWPMPKRAFERRRLHVSATWGGMVRLEATWTPNPGRW